MSVVPSLGRKNRPLCLEKTDEVTREPSPVLPGAVYCQTALHTPSEGLLFLFVQKSAFLTPPGACGQSGFIVCFERLNHLFFDSQYIEKGAGIGYGVSFDDTR